MQGTAGLSMLNTRSRSVAPFLSLVYGSHPFRRWWSQQKLSPEMRMCLHWRAHQLNLADHLSDHRRALGAVEEGLMESLDEVMRFPTPLLGE